MNENVYTYMFTDLKNQIGDKALEAAEFKARLIQAQAENENLQARVQELEALLEEQTKPAEEKGEQL
ncbi:hypothetical protein [Streptococcus constellatus]|uniref:hypothetical protein n=2 Tax=Streptococcus constellatus TaxID=76860 RepID=UPI0020007F92|nr:hypothetical protein [Streptococcus constellatus]